MSQQRIKAKLIALLAGSVLLSGIAQAQFSGPGLDPKSQVNLPASRTVDPAVLYPGAPSILLDQGDLLVIRIYGSPDYNPTVRVAADGTIELPLIGLIAVRGLTVEGASARIAKALVDAGMYLNPQVELQVSETPNHVINVVGEVKNPMLVPAVGQRRLLEALDAAGGLTTTASHSITIVRNGIADPIVVELGTDPTHSAAANIPIFSGDTVIVPRVGAFYILGATKTQGAFPLSSTAPTTLMQALSYSGGTLFEAKTNQVRIVRTVGSTRKEVRIDTKRISEGKDPDPIMMPEDIVYVPSSVVREAIKSNGIGTAIGVLSLVAYLTTR